MTLHFIRQKLEPAWRDVQNSIEMPEILAQHARNSWVMYAHKEKRPLLMIILARRLRKNHHYPKQTNFHTKAPHDKAKLLKEIVCSANRAVY